MTTKVTDQGILLPKEMFGDADEVEIRRENDLIIISPANQDPILDWGNDPVVADVTDASTNHDAYLHN